jgi:ferritin-like metal-binding protein YciE
MAEVATLQDLLVKELSDIYSAEKQILQALPKMVKAANAPELRQAFEHHLEETKGQVDRLDRVFAEMGEKPKRVKCKGMEGLIEEGEEVIKEKGTPAVLDAGLIAAAQRVEHYEIAAYGTVRTLAETLGNDEVAGLLQKTLDEEGNADKKLSNIAETTVNPAASVNVDAVRGTRNGFETNGKSSARSKSKTKKKK